MGRPPPAQVVTLGNLRFYRYLDLLPAGGSAPQSVYALPTTLGTVIGVCHVSATVVPADCERVLGTLRLTTGSVVPLGPDDNYARSLTRAVDALDSGVAAAQARFVAASKPAEQASAARNLASAYEQGATAVAGPHPSPLLLL